MIPINVKTTNIILLFLYPFTSSYKSYSMINPDKIGINDIARVWKKHKIPKAKPLI